MFHRSALLAASLIFLPLAGEAATVELVSRANPPGSNDNYGVLAMTPDGRYVVFHSTAPNVLPGQVDTNFFYDVFVHDRITGTTTLVTHASGSPNTASPIGDGDYQNLGADISADGRYIVFNSLAKDLVPGIVDRNLATDVFLYDRLTDTTTLVSQAAGQPGTTARRLSETPRISADGNYVVFESQADNLVAGQTEAPQFSVTLDLFLYHRPSGSLTLISRKAGSPATTASGGSSSAQISADGSFVVFGSLATDLVAGLPDPNSKSDVFLYQRAGGNVSLISRAGTLPFRTADGQSYPSAMSPDGRWIIFASSSTDLIAGQDDISNSQDIFLYDRVTGETRLVSRTAASPNTAAGGSGGSLSSDGRYVSFSSTANNLVTGQVDTNGKSDAFVYDRVTGTTALVSHARGAHSTTVTTPVATPPFSGSFAGSISADGRYIALSSDGLNLVPGQTDNNQARDVYLYDRVSRTAVLVSHARDSASTAANASSSSPRMSADGKVLLFFSSATNLVEGPRPSASSGYFFYLRDSAEVTHLPLEDPARPSIGANSGSSVGDISADGRYTVFHSLATNLIPGLIDESGFDPFFDPGTYDVFLRDYATGKTTLVSHGDTAPLTTTTGVQPVLSADGRFVAFLTSTKPPADPPLGLRLYDRTTDSSVLVNHKVGAPTQLEGSIASGAALSADGRYLAFACRDCNLVPGQQDGDPEETHHTNVFLYDRVTGTHTLVSHASGSPLTPGNRDSREPALSADGRFVVFSSQATNLVAGQAGGAPDHQHVFAFDRTTGAVTLVSRSAASAATVANLSTYSHRISPDGRWIAFSSPATDLVPGQIDAGGNAFTFDVFLHDRVSGTTVLVTHTAASPTTAANNHSHPGSFSADGRWLVFSSDATDLVAGVTDTNREGDVFLFDRVSGTTALISSAAGSPNVTASGGAGGPEISHDGSRITFLSLAPDLVPGQAPPNRFVGLFLQERSTGHRSFLGGIRSIDVFTYPSYTSFSSRMSANGRRVLFTSDLPLVPGDFNGLWDVYLWSDGGGTPGGPIPLPPCKLLDTRRRADRPVLTSDVQRTVTVRGACGVPATAQQVVVKVTALSASGKGNLRFYPGAVTASPSGILRFERNITRTETFTLPLSPNGTLTVLPFVAGRGTVHMAVEATAYLD